MERSTIFNGEIHYFYGHFQLLLLVHQRVPMDNSYPSSLILNPPKMGGFPSYQLSKPAENQETFYYASLWIINTRLET